MQTFCDVASWQTLAVNSPGNMTRDVMELVPKEKNVPKYRGTHGFSDIRGSPLVEYMYCLQGQNLAVLVHF